MYPDRMLLFIPTYNERENIVEMYRRVKALGLDLDMMFLDDGSPDGTGAILDGLAREDPRVTVQHRSGKQGVGTAHLAGIRYAYERRYTRLLTMDCDFTHEPERIPDLLRGADDAQLVIGSRWMRRESLAEWNLLRKFLTNFGHLLTRHVLKVSYDATSAFRSYRLDRIDPGVFDLVTSTSYSFFFESLYFLCECGIQVREVPVTLPKRTYGHSKMTVRDVLGSVHKLLVLYLRSLRSRTAIVAARDRQRRLLAAENVRAEQG